MNTTKKLGIWMDHSNAHLMELTDAGVNTTVKSEFTNDVKSDTIGKSEHTMHNSEQQDQTAYYKQLGSMILNYNEVLLFGPTEAKNELLNMLRADHNFEKIKIDVQTADKMTENQQHAFAKAHFSKQ